MKFWGRVVIYALLAAFIVAHLNNPAPIRTHPGHVMVEGYVDCRTDCWHQDGHTVWENVAAWASDNP